MALSGDRSKTARVMLYFVLALIALDVIVGVIFGDAATSPRAMSRPALYLFEGQAIETKLRALAASADAPRSAVRAGWVDDVYGLAERVPGAAPDARAMAVYGLSFSNQVGRALAGIAPGLDIRLLSAPAAPLSHSVYVYERDPESQTNEATEIVVLGVLLDQLPALRAMHEGGVSFRLPHAYQFPRYRALTGDLELVEPALRSFTGLQQALVTRAMWSAFRDQLAAHDDYFDTAVFDALSIERSFVLGLARRSWARHRQLALERDWENDADSEVLATARALLSRFASLADERGQRAVVILFNARHHFAAEQTLSAHLESEGIDHVRSSSICSPTDARNLIGDGHFTELCNAELARAVSLRLAR